MGNDTHTHSACDTKAEEGPMKKRREPVTGAES